MSQKKKPPGIFKRYGDSLFCSLMTSSKILEATLPGILSWKFVQGFLLKNASEIPPGISWGLNSEILQGFRSGIRRKMPSKISQGIASVIFVMDSNGKWFREIFQGFTGIQKFVK